MTCVSFASEGYYTQQEGWEQSCKKAGFDKIIKYREADISEDHRAFNYGKRGYGFWFWKPYFIRKALLDNAYVIYTDVDYSLINGQAIRNFATSRDVNLFDYPVKNRHWTKRDCFHYMDCDNEKYWDTQHLEAGISFWHRTAETLSLLNEWVDYAKDRRIISDDPNVCGISNLPEFQDHRHDQSILTNLKERHGILPHPIVVLRGIIAGADI